MEQLIKTEKKLYNYLNEFRISKNDYLKGNIFNQLMIIETYFQEVTYSQCHHYKLLKESKKLNINKVSSKTNISRSSIYNSPNILLHYINKRIEQINALDLTMLDSFNKQNDKISLLEKINTELQQQVVDSYEAKIYISELENEIKVQFDRRQNDINEIRSLKEQIKSLQNKLKKYNNENVINLHNENQS